MHSTRKKENPSLFYFSNINRAIMFFFRLSFIFVLSITVASAFVSNTHLPANLKLSAANNEGEFSTPEMGDVGFVLLAGGTGSRMKASMRK